AQLVARRAQLRVDVATPGIQLGRELVFCERQVELAGGGESSALREMILRGAQLRALERGARADIVGMEADGLGEFDDREVVVLTAFGCLSPPERGRCRAARGERAEQENGGSAAPAVVRSGWRC